MWVLELGSDRAVVLAVVNVLVETSAGMSKLRVTKALTSKLVLLLHIDAAHVEARARIEMAM